MKSAKETNTKNVYVSFTSTMTKNDKENTHGIIFTYICMMPCVKYIFIKILNS